MVLLFHAVTQNKKAERPVLSVLQHFRKVTSCHALRMLFSHALSSMGAGLGD